MKTQLKFIGLLGLLLFSHESGAWRSGRGAFPSNPNTVFPNITFKNIKTDYGASCDGTGTGDAAAFASWLTYGKAQGTTQVGLVIPAGANCLGCHFVWDETNGTDGIKNAVIWAFDATCTSISSGPGDGGVRIGGSGFYEDTTHSSLIQTAALNDTSVTLITAAEASRYAVGDWLVIGALELQDCCGFPPNFQFYQFVQVTAKNAGVISISPAVNSSWFKSTYPSIMSDTLMPNNGPASIFKMQPNWNTELQVFGLNMVTTPNVTTQDIISGRLVTCTYCTSLTASTSPSVCKTCSLIYSTTNGQEFDKIIESYSLINSTIRDSHNLNFQSPSPITTTVTGTNITGSLNGFPLSGTFKNSFFGTGINIGTTSFGHVNNNTFTNDTFSSAQFSQHYIVASTLTYNGDGTFSILKSAPTYDSVLAWAVPGFKYAFAGTNGVLNSSPVTSFTINDVTDQGTSIKIWTDLPNTLPTPTCNAVPCLNYQAYAGGTIAQTPSQAIDLTQYGAP